MQKSQNDAIADFLKTGHSLTPLMLRTLGDFLEALVRWALCWSYFMCWAISALLYLGILGLLLLKWLAY